MGSLTARQKPKNSLDQWFLLADHETIAHTVFSTRVSNHMLSWIRLRVYRHIVLVWIVISGPCRLVILLRKIIARRRGLIWVAIRHRRVNRTSTLTHLQLPFKMSITVELKPDRTFVRAYYPTCESQKFVISNLHSL